MLLAKGGAFSSLVAQSHSAMPAVSPPESAAFAPLRALLASRIAILEGPKGTMVQARQLTEADFRGERFRLHPHDLKGDNDILNLTQPALVEEFHRAYIEAGADLVSTNTFNGTRISQADYQTDSSVAEINRAAAEICVRAARWGAAKFQRRCFVAGALGPTNRTLSMSPDVNRPDYRAVTWAQVVAAYAEQASRAHCRRRRRAAGRNDLRHAQRQGRALRHRGSLRRTRRAPAGDDLGHDHRRLRPHALGPDHRAFYNSIRHARPFSVGLNCALGGRQMRPYLEELAGLAECFVTCYPNAGLPNAFGGYDETPADMAGCSPNSPSRLRQPGRRLLRLHARPHRAIARRRARHREPETARPLPTS
jgi:5-methyltetrahydrofolate--homocysteine methyltransferase